jgi:hypothetical protein
MLDTAGHDDKVARPQLDYPVPELDPKTAARPKNHLFHVIVVVRRECSLHLYQLHPLAVQLSHDLGLPLLRKSSKLFGNVDTFHTHPLARGYGALSHISRMRGTPSFRPRGAQVYTEVKIGQTVWVAPFKRRLAQRSKIL